MFGRENEFFALLYTNGLCETFLVAVFNHMLFVGLCMHLIRSGFPLKLVGPEELNDDGTLFILMLGVQPFITSITPMGIPPILVPFLVAIELIVVML